MLLCRFDVKSYYSSDRISMSLSNGGLFVLLNQYANVFDYWLGFQKMDSAIHLVSSNEDLDDSSPLISDSLIKLWNK